MHHSPGPPPPPAPFDVRSGVGSKRSPERCPNSSSPPAAFGSGSLPPAFPVPPTSTATSERNRDPRRPMSLSHRNGGRGSNPILRSLSSAASGMISSFTRSAGPGLVLLVWFILAMYFYVYFGYFVPLVGIHRSWFGVTLVTPLGLWIWFCIFYNHVRACFTPPKYAPQRGIPTPPDVLKLIEMERQMNRVTGAPTFHCRHCQILNQIRNLHSPTSSCLIVISRGPFPSLIFDEGLKPKPLRAHHCRVCQRCVLKHDHHCPWINGCVGLENYSFFYLFLIYLTIGCLFVVVVGSPYLWMERGSKADDSVMVFCLLLAGSAALGIGGLAGFHTNLLLTNQTTIEFQANKHRQRLLRSGPKGEGEALKINPFDLGKKWNFEAVFGPNPRRLEKRLRLLLQEQAGDLGDTSTKASGASASGRRKETWDDVVLSGGVWLHWLVPFRGLWDRTRLFHTRVPPHDPQRHGPLGSEDDSWSGQGFRGAILWILGFCPGVREAFFQACRKYLIGDESWLGPKGHEWWVTLEDVSKPSYTSPFDGRTLRSLDPGMREEAMEGQDDQGSSLYQRVGRADQMSKTLNWEKIRWEDWREDLLQLMMEEESFFAQDTLRKRAG